jgi:hypothetical protein
MKTVLCNSSRTSASMAALSGTSAPAPPNRPADAAFSCSMSSLEAVAALSMRSPTGVVSGACCSAKYISWRTVVSMMLLYLLNSRMNFPIVRAISGILSGPKRSSATTAMKKICELLIPNMCSTLRTLGPAY